MLEALLDTGSEVSLIKENVASHLQLEKKIGKDIPQLHGISGQKLRVLGHTHTTLTVGNNTPMKVKLIIVPDHYLNAPVLLGMNILGQITLTLDHKNRQLIWNNTIYPLTFQEHYGKVNYVTCDQPNSDINKPHNFVRLTHKFKMPKFTATLLEIKVEEPAQTMLLVSPYHENSQRGLPFLTTVTGSQTIFFPVINISKQFKTLHPGVLLAHYDVITCQNIEVPESAGCFKTRIGDAIGPDNDVVLGNTSRLDKLRQLLLQRDWTHLDLEQRDKLFELVLAHDSLFIVDKGELGLLQTTPAHISVNDPQPCRSPIYRYPEKAKEAIG